MPEMPPARSLLLRVTGDRIRPDIGRLQVGSVDAPCRLGQTGVTLCKREGDGASPAGAFPLRRVFYRADRVCPPLSGLAVTALTPDLGWCDDPADSAYNTLIKLPYSARHEQLWRDDGLYDVLAVIGYNDRPVVTGAGSAIFLHVAPPDGRPTRGCVGLAPDDLMAVLSLCGPETYIDIRPGD